MQDDYNEFSARDGYNPLSMTSLGGVSIADVTVAPFQTTPTPSPTMTPTTVNRPPRRINHAQPTITETACQRRQFNNPISYLGGPTLDPNAKSRTSIESVLSLD